MNRLSTEQRGQIISLMVEGMSMRGISRATAWPATRSTRLLTDLGNECAADMDVTVRNLTPERIECDEIWAFCYAKAKNVPEDFPGTPGHGDVWTWTCIDSDTKLVPAFLVGERTTEDCYEFLRDLRSRMVPGHRMHITTDGFGSYPPVIDALWRGNVDYMQVVKEYKQAPTR